MRTDRQIQDDVQAELKWEPTLQAEHIGVAVKEGIVTMTGNVVNFSDKWTAEQAVGRVSGVKGVAEELEVTLFGATSHTDSDIAHAAANALAWDYSVPKDKVKIKVEKGVVTLNGDVECFFQKDAARRAVASLTGVKWVTNMINIKPTVTPVQVEDSIKKTFARRARLDAEKITLEVNGGEVVLKGHVATWNEKQDAAMAAWATGGVTNVKNNLLVY